MRKQSVISLVLAFMSMALGAASALPLALLFPATAGPGAPESITKEATQAIKTYLRQTGKAEVVDFDLESPLIRRALIEHRIKNENLVGVTTPEGRLEAGRLLGANLVVTGDVSIKEDQLTSSVWLADVESRKVWRTQSDAAIVAANPRDRERATSNALQSATSTVVYQIANEILRGVKSTPLNPPTDSRNETTAVPAVGEPEPALPAAEPAPTSDVFVKRAEQFQNSGDEASAIQEYRKAINADPKNIDFRIKLAGLYAHRNYYDQALDELARAQAIDPKNEAVTAQIAKINEARTASAKSVPAAPDKSLQVPVKDQPSQTTPKTALSPLEAGDSYRKKRMYDDAEKQYRTAAEADPSSPLPHDRLVTLLESQSLFNEARKELDILQQIDKNAAAQIVSDRYRRFYGLAEHDIASLLSLYDNAGLAFAQHKTTREYYYELVRGVGVRIDSITRFLEVLTAPVGAASSHRHRILGASLMSQACDHTLKFLETNKIPDKDDGAIMAAEARKQLGIEAATIAPPPPPPPPPPAPRAESEQAAPQPDQQEQQPDSESRPDAMTTEGEPQDQ